MKIKKALVALMLCVTTLSVTACGFRVGNDEYMKQFEDDDNDKDDEEEGAYTSSNAVVKGYFEALQSGKQSRIKECFPEDSDSYSETTGDMDTIELDIDNIEIDSESLDLDELDEDAVKTLDIESAKQVTAVVPMNQTIDGVEYQVEETYDIITCCIDGYWYIYELNSKGATVVGQDNSTGDNGSSLPDSGNNLPGDTNSGYSDGDWCSFTQGSDSYTIEYQSGVPNTYMLSTTGTFEDLCDWIEYATTDYDTTVLKHVFSLYFVDDDYFETILSYGNTDDRDYMIACVASVAWTIDEMDGDTTRAKVYTSNNDKIYFTVDSTSLGEFELAWDTAEEQLYLVNGTSETKYDNGTFDSERLATFLTIVEEALGDSSASSSSTPDSSTPSSSTPSSSNTDVIDALDTLDTLTYSEASEMVSAIENFYNSTIIDIEDTSYSDSESVDFTLANGKSCRYFASTNDSKSVYDTSDTYETIWSVYR